MYEISIEPLQRVIKFYDSEKGESAEGRTRYTTSMLFTDLGLKECRIHLVQGHLNDHMNRQLFHWVKSQGYKRAQFEVPTGTPASRLATYEKTVDGLDHYTVDL